MDGIVAALAGYAADLCYEDLTQEALHAAKRCILDALGCSISSHGEEPVIALRRIASRVQSLHPATLIGTGTKTSLDLAALVNGTMIRYSDFSDDYFGPKLQAGPHPSDNIAQTQRAIQ